MTKEQVKAKFAEWKESLEGKTETVDSNSVSGVIYSLFWEMAAYESYVAICQANSSGPLATLLFGNLTAYNYIQVQALRIRRLCEPSTSTQEGKDTSVYSLRRIVDDMKQQRKAGMLIRDNICVAYGVSSDAEATKRQFDTDTAGVSGGFSTESVIATKVHSLLDRICDKSGLISKSLFEQLDERLLVDKNAKLSEIVYFVDKNIAHSASANSRAQVGKDLALRVADMKKVIQDISEVFFCCTMLVSQADTSVIPLGWDEQLTNLNQDETKIVSNTFHAVESESQVWKRSGYTLLGL